MNNYTKRYIANIVFEASSPLKVGCGEFDILQDSPILKDWNDLPMILGSSIAGVLRYNFPKDKVDDIFGDEDGNKKDNKGSRLIISNALLCDENMQVHEELLLPKDKSNFLKNFDTLAIREHARITDTGVADSKIYGKFDEEVVYKGARFKFRMELIANENDSKNWQDIINVLCSRAFRLGGGSTKGFGEIKIINELSSYIYVNLNSDEYANESSSLNIKENAKRIQIKNESIKSPYIEYELNIKPDSFFMFGSGFGDDDADMTPVYEKVVDYDKKDLSEEKILIPASSIKGALSHRTAFYYNYFMMQKDKAYIPQVQEKNKAVKAIFGDKKDEKDGKETGQKGQIFISDCILDHKINTKVFDHVKIDRFTGGGYEGALFQEKTLNLNECFCIKILLKDEISDEYKNAFKNALKDITNGNLALGGATTKGHGVFCGNLKENGVKI